MQIEKQTKLFAFKLADKKEQQATPAAQWQAREGVSVAGCSLTNPEYDEYRDATRWQGDNGVYC